MKGTVAEWNPTSLELVGCYTLNVDKIKQCAISKHYIATFSNATSAFNIFDINTKSLIGSF